ncbi:acylglycerol lipase [uncultured Gammaproteobacteria bacterium]
MLQSPRSSIWLSILALAGCASAAQPMGVKTAAPHWSTDDQVVIAADGYRLPVRRWLPEGPMRAVIVAVHGFADYSIAFAEAGPWLAKAGFAVYAYDQRGFGATANPGVWPGTATLVADLATMTHLIAACHPQTPLYLLGESMGGAVVITTLARTGAVVLPPIAGIVLSAPAVWGRKTMPWYHRASLWLANGLVPGLEVTPPRNLGIMPSDNIEMLIARGRDPLVSHSFRIDTLDGLTDLMSEAMAAAPGLTVTSLTLFGVHEQVLARPPVVALVSRLLEDKRRVAVYSDGWHMLLRDHNREQVLTDIAAWISDPAAPLPSGAEHAALAKIGQR